jgi:NTE family protein
MNDTATAPPTAPPDERTRTPDNVVLVLQGGGALGAYQAGVYQALHEAGMRPKWIIGTSIGAINASLIAGNAPEDRLDRLREFWRRVQYGDPARLLLGVPGVGAYLATMATVMAGVQSFFQPNPLAFAGLYWPLGADRAGYYSTDPLAATLSELVDFSRINAGETRLTVGAANVRTARMHYFDSRDMPFDIRHIMASGALPPAFPPVRIGDELFWDGGILSNTPIEAVFDDNPRRSALIFAVHVWNPHGPEPGSIWEVMTRQKDVQYASRTDVQVMRQKQIHCLRHVIAELIARLPETERQDADVKALAGYGCVTKMHVVRLLSPTLAGENLTKDIDFSPVGIRTRWQAGYDSTMRVIEDAPWEQDSDPLEGFVLHDVRDNARVEAGQRDAAAAKA